MPYTPTVWKNYAAGGTPLSAANLNKLTDELEAQASEFNLDNSLPTWANGAAPALTESAPLNEMERVIDYVAAQVGLTYTPTVWHSEWDPSRNAARLNQMEQQAQANRLILDSPTMTMEGPINITTGGTISNRWFRTTTTTPAVRVSTASPVTIQNCLIESTATGATDYLLQQSGSAAQLTISGCTFNGPSAFPSAGYGRAIICQNSKSVVVENCTINRTGGIYFQTPGTAPSYIVRRNRMHNVQGSASVKRQFVQFNTITAATQILVEWNEIVNEFGAAVSEDVISCYQSNGCVIRNNYIEGGYPATLTGAHQGTGIILGDGGGSNNLVEMNQVVGITNVGMGISGGNNNRMLNNTIVSDGRTPAGQILSAANNGLVCYTSSWGTPTNAIMSGNRIGFMSENAGVLTRNDFWTPNALNNVGADNTFYYNNHSTPITHADELAEWPIWQAKLAAAGITVGA